MCKLRPLSLLSVQVSGLVSEGKRPPSLTAIIVGDDKASQIYVRNKMKAAERCGLRADIIQKDSSLTQEELLELLDGLKRDDEVIVMDTPPLSLSHTHTHAYMHTCMYNILFSSISPPSLHSPPSPPSPSPPPHHHLPPPPPLPPSGRWYSGPTSSAFSHS